MKNRILLFFLVAISLLPTACDDYLYLNPTDQIETEELLETPTDFENAVRGIYSGLRQGGIYGGGMISIPDVLTDNLIICSEGRLSLSNYHYWVNLSSNSTWLTSWQDSYDVIRRANLILENINTLEDGDFKENIRAESIALRALMHLNLAMIFSKAPKIAGVDDLGIPYITSTSVTQTPDRGTVSETFENIENDLVQASLIINEDNGVGRLNMGSVFALLSRVYLYTEDWQNSIDAATAAINNGLNVSVATAAQFPNIWIDATEVGVAFKVRIREEDDVSIGVQYSQTSDAGVRSEYVGAYDFYEMYVDNDVRKNAYFSTSAFSGKTFNHIKKYFGRATGSVNIVDTKVIRWAEVYLNRAEAYAALDQDANALADLDMIRSNRYSSFVSGGETGQALKDEIDLQRRLELAFEGHRFFDLKRKNLPIQRSAFGDEADGTGVPIPLESRLLPVGSKFFQLPLPQEEIQASGIPQNPGY